MLTYIIIFFSNQSKSQTGFAINLKSVHGLRLGSFDLNLKIIKCMILLAEGWIKYPWAFPLILYEDVAQKSNYAKWSGLCWTMMHLRHESHPKRRQICMYASEQSNYASSDSRAARQVWDLMTSDSSTNNSKEAACILIEAVIFLSLDLKFTDQCQVQSGCYPYSSC